MRAAVLSDDPALVRAILDDRLASWARGVLDDPTTDGDLRDIASHVIETCAAIHASAEAEGQRLATRLSASGVQATTHISDQRHTIRLDVAPDDAITTITVLRVAGYESAREWVGAAARSFRRFAHQTVLTRSGAHSTVARVRWKRSAPSGSKLRSMIDRAVTPTPADWAMVDLPMPLWWAYGAIRPFRLAAERLGLASDEHGDLEPFLVTPDALLDGLFDVAGVDDTDVFADIGCGDGRIVVEAARRRGCRAIGVEQSAETAVVARQRAEHAGLSERVRIVHADAHDADLSGATVALLFVPMVVAERLVPMVLNELAPGGRVVLHEQSPLPAALPRPDRSVAIIAPDAATVAHRWNR